METFPNSKEIQIGPKRKQTMYFCNRQPVCWKQTIWTRTP